MNSYRKDEKEQVQGVAGRMFQAEWTGRSTIGSGKGFAVFEERKVSVG